jgi:hypothetical protein
LARLKGGAVLLVHLANGNTEHFDLRSEEGVRKWTEFATMAKFQAQIRGLTVLINGVSYSLARPVGFDEVFCFAEWLEPNSGKKFKGGERVTCQAGENRIVLMAHEAQSAVRVSVSKVGRQCYNPIVNLKEAADET